MRESLRRLTSEEVMPQRSVAGMRRVRVELLDGDYISIDLERKSRGIDLLDKICDYLDLEERDYFGLLHQQRGDPRVWVDFNRRLSKTFRNEPWEVRLAVKFYPPEPSELQDDTTRFQLSLAVRRDLLEGRVTCSVITCALLASYVLQAERGDCEGRLAATTLADHRVAPLHLITDDLQQKVDELYRKHKGQTPAEAELNYLENAKKLPLYGAELHCVRDCDEVDLVLAISASGISVYREGYGCASLGLANPRIAANIKNKVLMNRFPWAKITKISYNKRLYTLRLRPAEFDQFETQLSFRLPSTRACKKLWRCSVEHHIFFRRASPVVVPRVPALCRLGTRRVSCRRTLRQLRAHTAAA